MFAADLHRHLEGSFRLPTVAELAREHGLRLPADDPLELRKHLTVSGTAIGLLSFLNKFHWYMEVLADVAACERVAREAVEDAAAEGLDYLELRFSPAFMAAAHDLDPAAVVDAVVRGATGASAATGLHLGLIGILSRGFGADGAWEEWLALRPFRKSLVAVDLAGDERHYPARLFERHFEAVREAGLAVTIHAGEAEGAGSVRDAVERLGAIRIGHAARAMEDPSLLDLLGERGVGLECCLTSNLQTGAVAGLAAHPLRHFLEAGLAATINTDDPTISGINLAHEWKVARKEAGLDEALLRRAAGNSRRSAFSPLDAPRPPLSDDGAAA